ncbi:MAG: hypothetical protein IPO15_24410 [Anaerolineae bacterium]|nr:hypothetical protein [Anaerolineae bacterium]
MPIRLVVKVWLSATWAGACTLARFDPGGQPAGADAHDWINSGRARPQTQHHFTWWIRQAFTRALRPTRAAPFAYRYTWATASASCTARPVSEQKLGRPALTEEIAESMGLDSLQVRWMLRISRHGVMGGTTGGRRKAR